jgi:hypothetical protein
MKEVDWIPYLTTRLVDDAASHLRLFRQARAKMKRQRSRHKQQPSAEVRPSMIAGATETGEAQLGLGSGLPGVPYCKGCPFNVGILSHLNLIRYVRNPVFTL